MAERTLIGIIPHSSLRRVFIRVYQVKYGDLFACSFAAILLLTSGLIGAAALRKRFKR